MKLPYNLFKNFTWKDVSDFFIKDSDSHVAVQRSGLYLVLIHVFGNVLCGSADDAFTKYIDGNTEDICTEVKIL